MGEKVIIKGMREKKEYEGQSDEREIYSEEG